ncbi:hypothetical protein [Amycolatopsis sp. 195334CR]|uniref:hypothetical protein n=1 Tax=Amycolatopsis sp. 195334CR TaxID=2814588 RepID=UPI001A8CF59E|nr:hypothetical protein [Amycolatopsis sp. 195334CR]MBN6034096.1 hypothetical protein [Amycolatopsis sp. 195334CR]
MASLAQGMLTSDTLYPLGFRVAREPAELIPNHEYWHALIDTCDIRPPSDRAITHELRAMWSAQTTDTATTKVEQRILRYEGLPAAEAIGELRAGLDCGSYDDPRPRRNGARYTVLADLGLPPVTDVDAQHAFCERNDEQDQWLRSFDCTVLLARGSFATSLRLEASNGVTDEHTRAATQELTTLLRDALLRT